MSKRILNRREFMKTAGSTAAAVVAIAGTTTILASNRAWAMDLEHFSPHEAEVLLKMTRVLYPHDRVGDIYYAAVVEALDGKVKTNPEIIEQVKNGVAALDQAMHVMRSQFGVEHATLQVEPDTHTGCKEVTW